jgi:hypothetical protein
MARYLIEVPHDPDVVACAKVVHVFLTSGSHFLSHADWGCMDGDHRAWIIVEAGSHDEARAVVPPAFRHEAKVVRLNYFSLEKIEKVLAQHEHRSS